MLDGKNYYAAFPDENPERHPERRRMSALLDALEKLQKEFRQHLEQFRVETSQTDENKNRRT